MSLGAGEEGWREKFKLSQGAETLLAGLVGHDEFWRWPPWGPPCPEPSPSSGAGLWS